MQGGFRISTHIGFPCIASVLEILIIIPVPQPYRHRACSLDPLPTGPNIATSISHLVTAASGLVALAELRLEFLATHRL